MRKPIPFGKYYLLERINVGGMAEVFRAKAFGVEGFERLLAVKRILPNIAEDHEFITMFIDEAKIAVQLNHANIAQIFDLGVVDGAYFIALEHVFGRDLRAIFERCRQRGEPMPIAQACFVVMKVCEGLDYAHNKRDGGGREMNLVHRDVSPQNLLVSFEGEVKIIDFGIAKAAGKAGKTQAGILKGKFGYMSPEQVRGLPIDRRSDIFSTGIVLYELLTNERLFTGESDFSTLEKVRNVEILPPTTYNRRIPDELERIVLKALAKDVEDRYQNSIDLHDELQAFVYSAGEFYSRKDLAAWMKRLFSKEIEDETSKLEQYRQLVPPPEARSSPAVRTAAPPAPPPRRSTMSLPTVAPPAPPQESPGNGRAKRSNAHAAMQAQSAAPVQDPARTDDLTWDDDELETQIYDTPGAATPTPEPQAAAAPQPRRGTIPPGGAPPMPSRQVVVHPDLQLSQPVDPLSMTQPPMSVGGPSGGYAAPPDLAPQGPPMNLGPGPGMPQGAYGPPPDGMGAPLASTLKGYGSPLAPPVAGRPPVALGSTPGSSLDPSNAFPPPQPAAEPSAVVAFSNQFRPGQLPPLGRPMALPEPERRGPGLWIAIVALVLVAMATVAVVFYIRSGRDEPAKKADTTGVPGPVADPRPGEHSGPGASTQPSGPEADPDSGFDIMTDPAGARIKLDGNSIGQGPALRVRGLVPGKHVVEIEAPGFRTRSQEVNVEAGKSQVINLRLDALAVVGRFTSEPPGAKVTLMSDGVREVLGYTPVNYDLDPRKKYEAVFEKDGYITATRPLEVGAGPEQPVAVVLEKATVAVVTPPDRHPPRDPPRDRPPRDPPPRDPPPRDPPPRDPPPRDPPPRDPGGETEGSGFLAIGAKPQCRIYVDGRDTGLTTPQRGIAVKPGAHKITLINNEFNIKESYTVEVQSGETAKLIKDFSDRIQ